MALIGASSLEAVRSCQPEPVPCAHCGLAVPRGLLDPNDVNQFCCSGCRVVYSAIHASGLERYYCVRANSEERPEPARHSGRQFSEFDVPEFLESFAPSLAKGVRSIEFFLEGVTCSACVWLVEKLPRVVPGVIEARLDLGRALVKVVWREDEVRLSRIAEALDSLGYTPHVGRDANSRALRQREDRRLLVKIAVAGAGAGNVMLLAFALYGGSFHGMEHEYGALFRWMSLAIGLVVLLGPGALFFRGAFAAVRTRSAHLDLPIAIGLGTGAIAGTANTLLDRGDLYFDSLTGLVFLLLVGRYIQRRIERRATEAVERLYSLMPSFARLFENGTAREVPIESLRVDQVVEVRPGDSIPADGRVEQGSTTVDLSLLTGESRPVAVESLDRVYAGAVNLERPILVRVSTLGQKTRVGKLLALMQESLRRRAPIVQLADRFAGYFTIAAVVLFLATILVWQFIDARRAVEHAVTLLIVSCPCGLGLATPFVMSIALGRAARRAILVKGGEVLEKLAITSNQAPPTLFLDKTGTLTESSLSVVEWHGATGVERELAPILAALESQVAHPIARALSREWATEGARELPTLDPLALPSGASSTALPALAPSTTLVRAARDGIEGLVAGRRYLVGSEQFVLAPEHDEPAKEPPRWAKHASNQVAEQGCTPIWVSVDGDLRAVVGVGGRLRGDAAATLERLRALGMRLEILSGDDAATVAAVGRQLSQPLEHCHGGLSPEDKLQRVTQAQALGPVFMVGDGVNDAAALSASSVGIAVKGGAEASLVAADCYLGRSGVGELVELFEGATRTLAVVRRCLFVSLAYNVVAAALAMTGSINALIAAVLMPLASLTVLAIAFFSRTFHSVAVGTGSALDRS